MKTFLLTVALIVPSFTFAQSEWVLIGESVENFKYLIKDFSKTYMPDVYSGWVKTAYPPKINKRGDITKNGKYYISNWEINCIEKEYIIKHSINYNSEGKITSSSENSLGWRRILPDSMADGVFKEVCKNRMAQ